MTDRRIKKLRRKLQEARYRLLTREPELAAPLVEMLFVADVDVRRISTNGSCVYFDADWLEKLGGRSLDFALCHQLMHIRLGHLSRPQFYKGDRFHFACNIVANSSLIRYGFTEEKLPGIGEIRHETFYPKVEGCALTPYEAFRMTPLDPSALCEPQRRNLLLDSDEWWDRPLARAADGVLILSPDDPDPDDLILSERVRGVIERERGKLRRQIMPEIRGPGDEKRLEDEVLDDRVFAYRTRPDADLRETIREIRGARDRDAETYGDGGLWERDLRRPRIAAHDWRSLLNHFIMDETKDYSFTPPDRRLQDPDFFLPDYNASEIPRRSVLFMVDISASLSDREVGMAAAEICAAIEQFDGMLSGSVGFFDSQVRRVIPISGVEDLLRLAPYGGGGTDFRCIFRYVQEKMAEDAPSEIVVMTDGKGDFPEYEASLGIPVLWLLTSDHVRTPWGQAAYFRDP